MSPTPEIAAAWVAIIAYAVSSIGFTIGATFGKRRAEEVAVIIAVVGLVSHAAAIILRWVRIGHGPFLGFYEVASLLAFMAVACFLGIIARHRDVRIAGVAVMPVAFLVMGASFLVSKDSMAVEGSLASYWLAIHVAFANLAFGAYAASFALAVAYLMKHGKPNRRWQSLLDRFPEPDTLDALTYRFVGAGFVFQTVMIVSGSIWANEAWGRYWGWDPVETWSLIAWAVYAIYLHLTMTLGWRGKRAAWVAVFALPVILFSLLGVPIVYQSIHGAYLRL